MRRAARALIDTDALRHNYRLARQAAPGSKIIAMIKADAYGHGMLRVARALQDADALGVALMTEALELRAGGIENPIVCMQGFMDGNELGGAVVHDIQVVIHDLEQIEILHAAKIPAQPQVWVKLDTGMNRFGFPPTAAKKICDDLQSASKSIRLLTHLACADDRGDPATEQQISVFDAHTSALPNEKSIANSAGVLGWPATHRDWVRPGIMLYGASPFPHMDAQTSGLRPVMTLTAPLQSIKPLRRGERVGYGGTWTSPENMTIGLVSIGYGDGYPRHAETGTPVLVNERRSRILGRVSMDSVVIDLQAIEASVGDEVTLWGAGLPVEEVARHAGTIAYELLCGVGYGRVKTGP